MGEVQEEEEEHRGGGASRRSIEEQGGAARRRRSIEEEHRGGGAARTSLSAVIGTLRRKSGNSPDSPAALPGGADTKWTFFHLRRVTFHRGPRRNLGLFNQRPAPSCCRFLLKVVFAALKLQAPPPRASADELIRTAALRGITQSEPDNEHRLMARK